MLNTSLVGGMPTDPIMEYRKLGDLDFIINLFEINEPQVECCIPEDSYENSHYKITPRRVALEDQIESNSNFFLSEGLNDEIQKMLSYQKNLSSEDLKYKFHELFDKFLLSEEIEKARELLQFVIKFFPNEKNFVLAKKIIAPPKLVSSAKSEMEGIFKKCGLQFQRGDY